MKLWIVTAVDYGDSCNGKARVIGAFKSFDEAKEYVKQDMQDYIDANGEEDDFDCNFDKMSISLADCDIDDIFGCEWNIEEIEVT